MVYGHFGRPPLSRSAAFVVNGSRFPLEPERVLPECEVPERPAPKQWMQRVSFEETSWRDAYRWKGDTATRDASLIGVAQGDGDAA